MTRFPESDLEVSSAPTNSKKQQDLSPKSNAVRGKVEEIVLPNTNNFKKPTDTEEEKEALLR